MSRFVQRVKLENPDVDEVWRGQIMVWCVREGERVRRSSLLARLEGGLTEEEQLSEVDGVIAARLVDERAIVKPGDPFIEIDTSVPLTEEEATIERTHAELIADVIASPDDEAPCLAYAEWLAGIAASGKAPIGTTAEQAAKRARYVYLSCQAEQLEARLAKTRDPQLKNRHHEIRRELYALGGLLYLHDPSVRWRSLEHFGERHGFLHRVKLDRHLTRLPRLDLHPIQAVSIDSESEEQAIELVERLPRSIRSVSVAGKHGWAELCKRRELFARDRTFLELPMNAREAIELVERPEAALAGALHVSSRHGRIVRGPGGITLVAPAPSYAEEAERNAVLAAIERWRPRAVVLDGSPAPSGFSLLPALLRGGRLSGTRELDVHSSSSDIVEQIARCEDLRALETLVLDGAVGGHAAFAALPSLRELRLGRRVTNTALVAFAREMPPHVSISASRYPGEIPEQLRDRIHASLP